MGDYLYSCQLGLSALSNRILRCPSLPRCVALAVSANSLLEHKGEVQHTYAAFSHSLPFPNLHREPSGHVNYTLDPCSSHFNTFSSRLTSETGRPSSANSSLSPFVAMYECETSIRKSDIACFEASKATVAQTAPLPCLVTPLASISPQRSLPGSTSTQPGGRLFSMGHPFRRGRFLVRAMLCS